MSGSSTNGAGTRLAVFDLDGTLIDSQHSIVAAMQAAFVACGLSPPSADAIRRNIGLTLADGMAKLLPEGDESLRDAIVRGYRDAFAAMRADGTAEDALFPGAAQALDALETEGWLLGIATGKSRRGLDAVLAGLGLGRRFVTLQTPDNNPGKPHPGMIERALAEAGVEPGAAAMVGDTAYDMVMGKRAGVRAVGVAWGYHPADELVAAGADAVAADYPSLPGLLDRLV